MPMKKDLIQGCSASFFKFEKDSPRVKSPRMSTVVYPYHFEILTLLSFAVTFLSRSMRNLEYA